MAESASPAPTSTPAPHRACREPSRLRRNLAVCTGEGFVAMPIVYLSLPGNFIVAMLLTQVFPLGRTLFGVIVSLPWWCNVLQIAVMPFLTRRWSQKNVTLTFSWLHVVVWAVLGTALPWIQHDDPARVGELFFAIFAFSALFQSVFGVAWTSWIQEWVPDRVRGKYFGRRNRLLQLSMVAFLLFAGEALTRLQAVSPILGFQVVIGLSVVLRVFSIFAQQRILSTSAAAAHEGRIDLPAQLRSIGRAKPLLWLFAFGATWGLTANVFGAFFNVYMYESLGRTVGDVSMLTLVTNITGAVALPAWGLLLDRYGNRGVMSVALFAWVAPGFLWAILTPENAWILWFIFAWGGIFQAGFVLGQFNILLKLVPAEAKTAAISLNVAVTSLAAAVAPVLGGALLDAGLAHGVDKLQVYHAMSIAHHAVVLLSIPVLLLVSEPKASSLGRVVGAMRSSRQLLALFGLSFLVNYVFTKRGRPASGTRAA